MKKLAVVWIVILGFWAPNASADQVKYLARPEQSLAAFMASIDRAQKSIDLATFIFKPCDPSTRILMEKLSARARAGVKVRLLLDAFQQQDAKDNIVDDFARSGVEVRYFSNSIFDINIRLHSKFMIVDGATYIAGGRNLDDTYFGLSDHYNYVDRDVFVNGTSAREASRTFNELWVSKMATPFHGDPNWFEEWDSFCHEKSAEEVHARMNQIKTFLARNTTAILASAPTRQCPSVAFKGDSPDFGSQAYGSEWKNGEGAKNYMTAGRLKRKRATEEVLRFVLSAQSSLFMENWVYMPIESLEKAFAHLRSLKVPVDILTNSDMEEEGPDFFREAKEYAIFTHSERDAVGTQKVGLVSSLGSLESSYALTPVNTPYFIHSKVGVRDGKDVIVGSFNLDSRSTHTNLESVVSIKDCPELAGDVRAGGRQVRAAYEADEKSGEIPAKPEWSFLAKFLAELLITEF